MTSPTGVWFEPQIGLQLQKAWFPVGPSASLTPAVVWRWRGFSTTKVRNGGNEIQSAGRVWIMESTVPMETLVFLCCFRF